MYICYIALSLIIAAPGARSAESAMNHLQKLKIGGIDQWLLIRNQRDQDEPSPVLLFLHGGPGMPIIPFYRDFDASGDLEKNFVMAYWDQRGAGRSFNNGIPVESMNIEQFISDTHEIVEALKKCLKVHKVYLAGHSWGSIVGLLTVLRYPQLFHAYIGISQVVDVHEGERISYEFALKQAFKSKNLKAIKQLSDIGPPPHEIDEMRIERNWVKKFGRMRVNRSRREMYGRSKSLTFSTAIIQDAVRFLRGARFSIRHLWEELQQVDLFEQAPNVVDVPVFFLAGRHDYYAPTQVLERYYQQLQAPQGKHMIWFEKSAHEPFSEQPEKFRAVLIRQIRRQTETGEGGLEHQPTWDFDGRCPLGLNYPVANGVAY